MINLANTLATKLTIKSGNLVDFFNIAGLAMQRSQESILGLWSHYSWRELFVRGGILTTIVLSAALAARTSDEASTSVYRGIGGATLGFFVSHSVAVWPTVQRRHKIKKATALLITQIDSLLAQIDSEHSEKLSPNSIRDLKKERQLIAAPSLTSVKRGDALRNLIADKRRAEHLMERVESVLNALEPAQLCNTLSN